MLTAFWLLGVLPSFPCTVPKSYVCSPLLILHLRASFGGCGTYWYRRTFLFLLSLCRVLTSEHNPCCIRTECEKASVNFQSFCVSDVSSNQQTEGGTVLLFLTDNQRRQNRAIILVFFKHSRILELEVISILTGTVFSCHK